MFCTHCGAKNQTGSNFCYKCGSEIVAPRPLAEVTEPSTSVAKPEIDEARVARLLDKAFELFDTGATDQAFEVCTAAMRLNSDSVTGRSLLSAIYEKKGDLDAAIRQMERVVEGNPDSVADVNRLETLRRKRQILLAESGAPIISRRSENASFIPFFSNPRILIGSVASLLVMIAIFVFAFGGGNREQPTTPTTSATASTGATASTTGPQQNPVTPATPTVQGSIFDDLAPRAQTNARSTRQEVTRPVTTQGNQAQATPAPQPANRNPVNRQPAPSPVTTTQPPAPAPPAIRITRDNGTGSNSQPSTNQGSNSVTSGSNNASTGTGGKDYQKLAMDAKRKGDREAAISNFRKAIDAFRAEAGRDGGGFESSQGIRSCQLELKLLGASE